MTSPSDLPPPADDEVLAPAAVAPPAPVRVRNAWLVLLTVFAGLYFLHWASPVLMPVMLGILISCALSPVVNAMQRWHIHRAIGAALLLLGLVAVTGGLVYSLSDEAASVVEALPKAAQKFRRDLRAERGSGESAMQKVQKAATELEQAAAESGGTPVAVPRGVTRVQIEKSRLDISDLLWTGTLGAAVFLGQLVTVLFFAYFLIASGDQFRRKLISISGRRLSEKKVTAGVLDEITKQIQRYLLVQLLTSVLVGVVSWAAFAAIGLENAAIWGIAAGVLNSVPYFGPVVVSGGIALVAYAQFGTFGMALTVSGIALVITSIEGYLLTPWLIGKTGGMNAVVVFASVIVGGWLWGAMGLLLGVPILMMVKSVCDHVEGFRSVGELLGD